MSPLGYTKKKTNEVCCSPLRTLLPPSIYYLYIILFTPKSTNIWCLDHRRPNLFLLKTNTKTLIIIIINNNNRKICIQLLIKKSVLCNNKKNTPHTHCGECDHPPLLGHPSQQQKKRLSKTCNHTTRGVQISKPIAGRKQDTIHWCNRLWFLIFFFKWCKKKKKNKKFAFCFWGLFFFLLGWDFKKKSLSVAKERERQREREREREGKGCERLVVYNSKKNKTLFSPVESQAMHCGCQ